MENLLKDLGNLIKLPNDSKVQLKAISILNEILENLKKLEKKKLTDCQSSIEDTLHNYIINSRANSDICNRYIYFIYKYLFDFGLSSRLNEFISKYSTIITSSKNSVNVKCTALWILGKVCCKSNYKSPNLVDLIHLLVKTIKNTGEIQIKNECFLTLHRLLLLKLPNFYNQISDIIKIILKQEKYFQTEVKCRKNILKALNSALYYLNQNTIVSHYESLVNFLNKSFEDEENSIRKLAVEIFVNFHSDKLFDQNIDLKMIMRKKSGEPLKNFLEVLLYFGNHFTNHSTKNDHICSDSHLNLKLSFIQILKMLFEKNIEFINSSESLIMKVYDLLISIFQLNYVDFITNNTINYKQNFVNFSNVAMQNSLVSVRCNFINQNRLNNQIEELYRFYIKLIYHTSYRKSLMKHVFKRLNDSQSYLDNIENDPLSGCLPENKESPIIPKKDKKSKKDLEKEKDKVKNTPIKEKSKYTESHVNSMLFSLVEFSEHNFDIFEVSYKSFSEISQNLVVYLISSVKSFRLLINRVLINLTYFIPSWRIPVLTLILNLSSVAHAEVAALKNTYIYLVDESSPEYKYALIIRNNLDLLKDISNCLGIVLSTFAHKNTGCTVDMSNAALTIAKNMIIGKFADEEDNPKSMSLKEKTGKFNYSNSDVDAHKEAGWMIIQGLSSMDYTWLTNNYKTLFQLWKYVFSEHACSIEESELQKPEYREALLSEFFIKKSALASLRKFILSSYDFVNSQMFQVLVPKFLYNALSFFIPYEKKKVLSFYKTVLKENYKESKYLLYDCFFSIPIKLYSIKSNQLLYPLCDDITAGDYSNYSLDYILNNLNYFDSFMCEKKEKIGSQNNLITSSINQFLINNFNIEKFSLLMTERLTSDVNSKLVDSSLNLLVDILLDNNLNGKNRQLIFKHLLTHMSEISMKSTDKFKLNKAINIVYSLFLILKKSSQKNIPIINDESIFASSKMIFDIGFKIEDGSNSQLSAVIRRISAEGHSLLIKVSSNPQYNINYYLTAMECKFKNESNIDNQQFINTFYMIANIFRNNSFSNMVPYLDLYMNFIISYFNRIEDLFNPYISQSVYIITETLIRNNQIDHARKMIEVFKLNYLFFNKDNIVFFKERQMIERNSLTEIRLMMLLVLLGENIKNNEIELLKLLLNKYMLDEKYKSQKIKKNFLFFAKMILIENGKKLKELVHNKEFLQFLVNNVTSGEEVYDASRLDIKFSLQILILYLMTMDSKNIDTFKEFCEKLVNSLNNFYNSNRHFYFNNQILSNIECIPSNEELIYDKNSEFNLAKISYFLDLENKNISERSSYINCCKIIYFDSIYHNFILIKLSKIFLKIYFEKKFGNFSHIINLIKEIIQNQLILYSTGTTNKSTVVKTDSLTKSEETKEDLNLNKPLLTIRKLSKTMHISLKKFLIKSLKHCLYLSLSNLNNIQISNKNSNIFIEFLNYFMNTSMLLISCEECWDIKIKGVELLLAIIEKFSKIKDNRTDDDSLLIQQYEAQISSCIKNIFTNTYNIRALFKGIKLLYLFISVPITTDFNFIKKISNYVDLNLKESSAIGTPGTLSEKFDHLLICKKLNFYCKMYLTTNHAILNKGKKISTAVSNINFNIVDVVNSEICKWQVNYEFIKSNESLKILSDYFCNDFDSFFMDIYYMLNDFYLILTGDKMFVKNYKNFEFLSSGNRISYSNHKVLKYGQIYIKILGYLVNDTKFLNQDVKQKILKKLIPEISDELEKENSSIINKKSDNSNSINIDSNIHILTKPRTHSDYSFDNIFSLIFYYLNYFTIKKLQSYTDYKTPEYIIYSESDITDELKEKILLNNLLVHDLVDVILNLLKNSGELIKITKNTFFEIFKSTINLFTLSIEEIDIKLFAILELLLTKWYNSLVNLNINNSVKECFSNEELNFIINNISKLCYFYYNNKINSIEKENSLSIVNNMIEILSFSISNLNLREKYTSSDIELIYHLFNIIFSIFETSASPITIKLCASKIFPLFIKIESLETVNLILPLFKQAIIHSGSILKQFDKFFLIYFMLLQSISKRISINNKDEIAEVIKVFLIEELFIKLNQPEISLFIFKSLLMGISQNFDDNIKILIENILINLFEKNLLIKFFAISEELQNITLSYVLSLDDVEKRRILIKLIVLLLNDNAQISGMEMIRVCLVILKLLSKDLDYLKDLAPNLDPGILTNLDNLIKMQQAQQIKINEERNASISQNNLNQILTHSQQVEQTQQVSSSKENEISEINKQITHQGNPSISNFNQESSSSTGGPKLKALKFKK